MESIENDTPSTILGGRYEILETLGAGGMAKVYHARDLNLQRQVAIKLLREDFTDDPAFRVRFLQEARAAANLVHPNIVTVFDFGHESKRYFIVMEFVQGTDLKTLIRRRGRLQVEEAIEILIQVASGVGYAHRAGLIHCDLKPHNILVTHDGRAKITDFGISRALAAIDQEEYSEIVWGSPQYFAPEQAAGGPPSPASDVYSLGIVLYEAITGRLPFEAADPVLMAELHQAAPPPSPRQINPDIPQAVEQIILKVLSKEPSARYRTADQFSRVLSSFRTEAAPPEIPPPPVEVVQPRFSPEALTSPYVTTPSGGIDWLAVFLGLLAFMAVGGLVPLWLWACLLYPSCPLNLF